MIYDIALCSILKDFCVNLLVRDLWAQIIIDSWSKIIVLVCYIHGCFMTLLLETRQWRLDRKAGSA